MIFSFYTCFIGNLFLKEDDAPGTHERKKRQGNEVIYLVNQLKKQHCISHSTFLSTFLNCVSTILYHDYKILLFLFDITEGCHKSLCTKGRFSSNAISFTRANDINHTLKERFTS